MTMRAVSGEAELYLGDCLEVLPTLAAESIDAVVCDPPYELGFMGKAWDKSGVAYRVDLWREVWRVLKPGGHLLAFGGARTYHRLACAIEDAGFEIRDQIMWLYGSGFPKSLDISKALDKTAGAERPDAIRGGHMAGAGRAHGCDSINAAASAYEKSIPAIVGKGALTRGMPATPAAQQWDGWGTALKPAHEPIVVARKPLSEQTVAANVLRWGCGGINVDGGRIETGESDPNARSNKDGNPQLYKTSYSGGWGNPGREWDGALGRFPANVILDEGAAAALDEQSGRSKREGCVERRFAKRSGNSGLNGLGDSALMVEYAGTGGASRFFYCAKASRSERDAGLEDLLEQDRIGQSSWAMKCNVCGCRMSSYGKLACGHDDFSWVTCKPIRNIHPTVKPLSLMRYLCRLVTPPGGVILDPFLGSGSTGCAATLEGFSFIGIEKEADFMTIAERRIAHWQSKAALPLFELAEIEAAR